MLPGPNQIISCPHCGALEYYETLMSGNTFGAKLYSDGKQIAPYMPQPPPFVECHACNENYWLKDAVEVGTISPWSDSSEDEPSWKQAPLVESPSEEKLYAAIEAQASDDAPEELRRLRFLVWHKRNDAYRADSSIPIELTPSACKNMQHLSIEISDGARQGKQVSLGDGLIVVELLREQGYFEGALEMLEKNKWGDLHNYAQQIAELCRQKNNRVVELSG